MIHRYEGTYAIVVWPRDQAKWRKKFEAPPSQETVTLQWWKKDGGRHWSGYLVTFHLDGYRLFLHKTHVAKWLEKHEARSVQRESAA